MVFPGADFRRPEPLLSVPKDLPCLCKVFIFFSFWIGRLLPVHLTIFSNEEYDG
jgi:hypothetical protein